MQEARTKYKARWYKDELGAWICFNVPGETAAAMAAEMDGEKEFTLSLKEYRKKRSLDANAMFWSLVGQLSAVIHIPPMEIYRHYIMDIGGNFEIIPIKADRVGAWDRIWCEGHDGRMCVDMGPCVNLTGYHNIRTYFGSSDYDSRQMSQLIDYAIEDCRENGIDIVTDEERDRLLTEWERNHG